MDWRRRESARRLCRQPPSVARHHPASAVIGSTPNLRACASLTREFQLPTPKRARTFWEMEIGSWELDNADRLLMSMATSGVLRHRHVPHPTAQIESREAQEHVERYRMCIVGVLQDLRHAVERHVSSQTECQSTDPGEVPNRSDCEAENRVDELTGMRDVDGVRERAIPRPRPGLVRALEQNGIDRAVLTTIAPGSAGDSREPSGAMAGPRRRRARSPWIARLERFRLLEKPVRNLDRP